MTRIWLILIFIVAQIAVIFAPFRFLWAVAIKDYSRCFEILKAYDRLGNAETNGKSNETISSRANRARNEDKGWGCILCGVLDKIQKDHCKNSDGV